MGWNTTVVLNNDRLDDIGRNPDFGKELVRAAVDCIHEPTSTSRGEAIAVETHHADGIQLVAVGNIQGYVMPGSAVRFGPVGDLEELKFDLLQDFARQLGYRLTKKKSMK